MRADLDFALHLDLRSSGRELIDLTERDPARCRLASTPAPLEAIPGGSRANTAASAADALAHARDAVASYLAGRSLSVAPDRAWFVPSRGEACRVLLELLCGSDGEVLVGSPLDPSAAVLATAHPIRSARYALTYDGTWHLDRRSLAKAVTSRTRAILVGTPWEPTGAVLSADDLAFVEDLCSRRRVALVGDETFADTVLVPCASVLQSRDCLAFQIGETSSICGIPGLGGAWLVAAGPEELVRPARARLDRVIAAREPIADLPLVPAALARREPFLAALRARLAENRASLATSALREAPWTLQWGSGGRWAVLQIGAAEDAGSLCAALLKGGIVVHPGCLHGLPRAGYLVVSLMPPPETFREGLARLDRQLRAPLFR